MRNMNPSGYGGGALLLLVALLFAIGVGIFALYSAAALPPANAADTCEQVLTGNSNGNRLDGNEKDSCIYGRGGNDKIYDTTPETGTGDEDHLYGGDGKDLIDSRDHGADFVDGGKGKHDRCLADGNDTVVRCEILE